MLGLQALVRIGHVPDLIFVTLSRFGRRGKRFPHAIEFTATSH